MKSWLNFKTIAMILFCQFMVGCATTVVPTPGSDKIQILGSVKNRCKNMGEIYTDDMSKESFYAHNITYDKSITQLKNKAFTLGANVIVLADHESSQKTIPLRMGKRRIKNNNVIIHSMKGTAYYCPK